MTRESYYLNNMQNDLENSHTPQVPQRVDDDTRLCPSFEGSEGKGESSGERWGAGAKNGIAKLVNDDESSDTRL